MVTRSLSPDYQLSDHYTQYEQDEFIVEISLFDEFDDEDDFEIQRDPADIPTVH